MESVKVSRLLSSVFYVLEMDDYPEGSAKVDVSAWRDCLPGVAQMAVYLPMMLKEDVGNAPGAMGFPHMARGSLQGSGL